MRSHVHLRRTGSTRRVALAVLLLAVANRAAATTPDTITMHYGAKAAIPVLANDAGAWVTNSVVIAAGPAHGTATALPDGRIRYEHTTGMPASDAFSYTVTSTSGVMSAATTVTVTFSTSGRLAATTLAVPMQPPSTTYEVVDAFPNLSFSAPVSIESPRGDSNRLFVVERRGTITVITNVGAVTPGKTSFLDISSSVTNDFSELGLKGIAFHPGYITNGIFFVTYTHTSGTARLSRFLRSGSDPDKADPTSELVLIDQPNDALFHNINDGVFGPDGYLYIGMGDEGQPGTNNPNVQVITQDLWSAVLRIDVDKRPGNLEPHPHPAIPTPGGLARFSIPADNPFIGATQFNGIAISSNSVRTEFYAVGFRNPWTFSFDEVAGDLWLGDVGDRLWEEVNVITAGANAGWAYVEGTNAYENLVPPPGFTYHKPVWQYPHDNGSPFGGSAIIAGLVVRRDGYPDLLGKFVCADVLSGNIWAITRGFNTTIVERIAGWANIVQFGLDPSNNDILMVDYGLGKLRRLLVGESTAPYPAALSDTGIFADLADLSPNPGVVPYEINLPFWSDYALKQRWFAITNLVDTIVVETNAPWSAPTGTVWVKHFDLDLDRGNAATRKRIETRVLVRTTAGSYGVSYRWNEAGTEAFLAPDIGENIPLSVTNSGVATTQVWRIPSRAECLVCHGQGGAHALSFNTRQMNRPGTLAGAPGNMIELLTNAGYVANAIGNPRLLPRHVRPDEVEFSVEARARAYIAVNCGYCHRGTDGSLFGAWDGRAQTRLSDCGIVNAPAGDNGGDTNNLLLVPGDTAHSIIWNRIGATNGFTRMPPLATSEIDPTGVALIAAWIEQELPAWQSYAQWRTAIFGATNAPNSEPGDDPDGDGQDNYAEFLGYSDPTNRFSAWGGEILPATNGVTLAFSLFNRSVRAETSTNLVDWTAWDIPGNEAIPAAANITNRLTDTDTNALRFYRLRIEER